jgi:cobyrinic acid a,c-diamide synthase
MPIYAECGGFMYLGRTLTNFDGIVQPMAGLLGFETLMDRDHLVIRYVAVRTEAVTPLGPAGTEARGQEFHQSRVIAQDASSPLYRVTSDAASKPAGMHWQGVAGSYVHLHFASNPDIPRNFVESCRAWRQRRKRQ